MLLFEMPAGFEFMIMGMTVLLIIPAIFYLLTLQSTLNAISSENRKMPPEQVWLLLIPLFNLVWHFIVVDRMADSLKAEVDRHNLLQMEQRPAYGVGLAMCILACCIVIPVAGMWASVAGLVCWIIYWVKISSYKTLIAGQK